MPPIIHTTHLFCNRLGEFVYYTGFASSILNGMLLLCGTARTQRGIYKNAVFDTKKALSGT